MPRKLKLKLRKSVVAVMTVAKDQLRYWETVEKSLVTGV